MSPSPRSLSPALLIDFSSTPQAVAASLRLPPPFVARQPLFIPSSPSPPPVAGPSHCDRTPPPPSSPQHSEPAIVLPPLSPAISAVSIAAPPALRRGSRHRRTLQDDTFLDSSPAEARTRLLVAQETLRQTEVELNRWLGTRNLANDMIYGLRVHLAECAAELRGAQCALEAVDSDDEDFESTNSGSDVKMAETGFVDDAEGLQNELDDLRRDAQRER